MKLNKDIVEIKRLAKDEFAIDWDLSNKCNYSCSYCSPHLHDLGAPLMKFEDFKITVLKLVKEIKEKTNTKYIRLVLTGGEPFLHLNLQDMIQFAISNGIDYVMAQTNGSASKKRYIETSKYLTKIGFSTQWEHIKWGKFLNKLVSIKQDIQCYMFVNLMIYPGKLNECDKMIDTFEKFNIDYAIRRIRPLRNQNPNYYTEEEICWLNKHVK